MKRLLTVRQGKEAIWRSHFVLSIFHFFVWQCLDQMINQPFVKTTGRVGRSSKWCVWLQKHFYGPLQRKMGGLGFIRLGVWQNFIRAWRSGYQGNMNGEGFILGGVFVIGAGDQVASYENKQTVLYQSSSISSFLSGCRVFRGFCWNTERKSLATRWTLQMF